MFFFLNLGTIYKIKKTKHRAYPYQIYLFKKKKQWIKQYSTFAFKMLLPLFSNPGDPMRSREIYIRGQLVFLPSDLWHLSSEMASSLLLQWLSGSHHVGFRLSQTHALPPPHLHNVNMIWCPRCPEVFTGQWLYNPKS